MPARVRRRRLFAGAVLVGALAVAALIALSIDPRPTPAPQPLRIVSDSREIARFPAERFGGQGRLDATALRVAVTDALAGTTTTRQGSATVTYRYDVAATLPRAIANARSGGKIEAVRRPIASEVTAPVIRQAFRNNCESAALSVLLATTGLRIPQTRLQQQLPTSGPLDPRVEGTDRIWGDPELGFVGRPDGGGSAGGFGVYQRPVAGLARRYGRRLEDLTRTSPASVYRRVLQGHAVLAWVGLSQGPYGGWLSPTGRPVRVNFGEHTVVVVGVDRDGSLNVVNPLQGTRETWTKAKFESMWQLLGRRALAT